MEPAPVQKWWLCEDPRQARRTNLLAPCVPYLSAASTSTLAA